MLPPDKAMLRGWAARGSYLDERLAGAVAPGPGETDAGAADARVVLRDWRRIAARDDAARFGARAARTGLDEPELLARLGPVAWPAASPLPDWAARAPELIALVAARPAEPAGGRAPPFAGLFLALADTLTRRVMAGRDPALWGAGAGEALAADLVLRLSAVFTESLYGWFDAFRAVHRRVAGEPETDPAGSTALHDAFLDWLRTGHFARLLDRFPVLVRLLAVCVGQWEAHAAEFARRFEADRADLVATLLEGRDPGPVTDLALGLSDPHDHGRGVVIAGFAAGARVVYKPRDLRVDVAWGDFLRGLATAGCPTDLRAPAVLPRHGYGWTAFIARAPCADPAGVRAFFRRAGRLLALLQVLGAGDFHQSNVIASGDQPVPVDLETLLRPAHPEAPTGHLHPATRAALGRLRDPLQESGYLPYWNRFRALKWVGGGLGWFVPERFTVTGFQHIATDAMRIGPVQAPADRLDHLPLLDGAIADPLAHADAIEAGYVETATALVARRAAVHAALDAFRGASVRPILRDTQFYEFLNRRSLQPASLGSGLAFSLEFEFLNRLHPQAAGAPARDAEARDALAGGAVAGDAVAQVTAEQRALERLDVPLFRMGVEATTMTEAGGGEPVRGSAVSPLANARARLDRLDAPGIATQARLVRLTLTSTRPRAWGSVPWPPAPEAAPWSAGAAVDRARAIGERLRDRAVLAGDGAAWIGVPNGDIEAEARLAVLDVDLYDGAAGIAVFLAALGRVTAQAEFTDLALRALAPARRRLARRRDRDAELRRLGLGGAAGAGGLIYALTVTADLAARADLLDDADWIAEGLSDRQIAADLRHDVVGGAAGAVLGLLALHGAGRPVGLERAAACGRHLLRVAPVAGRSLAGFSHGAAGFAYALHALARATGEARFTAAAAGWLAHERTLYDPAARNWGDIRFATPERPEPDVAICRWCHGAPGVGLGRLGLGGDGDGGDGDGGVGDLAAHVAGDLDNALARTLAEPMSDLDGLCCGNFGRIDFLLEAGLRRGRPDLVAAARARAAARLACTGAGHGWMVGGDDDNLGLFQGCSGVGYGLLRLAAPETLPCLLLWRRTAEGAA